MQIGLLLAHRKHLLLITNPLQNRAFKCKCLYSYSAVLCSCVISWLCLSNGNHSCAVQPGTARPCSRMLGLVSRNAACWPRDALHRLAKGVQQPGHGAAPACSSHTEGF